ncbi:MAG: hypothetical protein WCJ71_11125, partial [Candidatus Omnitrophota bacterium]
GSPTTPRGALSTTTPFGSSEPAFDLCELAIAAGANYVARWTSYHVKELTKAEKAGMENRESSRIGPNAKMANPSLAGFAVICNVCFINL